MSGFSKLWSEIVTSSIWSADDKTRILWITLLALKNKDGFVAASIPGLANAARVSIPDCERAITILEAPDPYSRSKEHEGRRIMPCEGGWTVLNHFKYRDKDSSDDPTAKDRVRRWRERQRNVTNVTRNARNSVYVSVSASGIPEGVKGEIQEIRPGLLGLFDKIRTCRPEYAHMREMDVVTLLSGNKNVEAVTRMVDGWCMEQRNASDAMGNPIASLRTRMTNLSTPASSESIRETDPGILDYAKQLLAFQATRGEGIGDFYRKIRDNYGPTGVDRVKRAAKQIATAAQKEWMEREVK
jgi:hypothetical protein